MALPANRIEIRINLAKGNAGVVLLTNNARVASSSIYDGNRDQWFGGGYRRAQAIITAANAGTHTILATDDDGTTWHAYHTVDEDPDGTPVIHPIEDAMWDHYILDNFDVRTSRRVSRIAPNLGSNIIVPANYITTNTFTNDTYIGVVPPFDFKFYDSGVERDIGHVRIYSRRAGVEDHLVDVIESPSIGHHLGNWTIRLQQGTKVVSGILGADNRYASDDLDGFVDNKPITVRLTAPTVGASQPGLKVLGQNAASRPAAPSGAVYGENGWDTSTLGSWESLNTIAATPANQSRWLAFVHVAGSSGTPIAQSRWSVSYGGDDAIQYTTDATPDSSSTWTSSSTGAVAMRIYNPNGWSEPIFLNPVTSIEWITAITVEHPANGNSSTVSWNYAPSAFLLDDLSEFKVRWRKLNSDADITLVRVSKSIPIIELKRTLVNFNGDPSVAVGALTNTCWVMMGWTDGKFNDVIPLHPPVTSVAAVASPNYDVAFALTFMRPSGRNGENEFSHLILHHVTTPTRRAYVDLLVR